MPKSGRFRRRFAAIAPDIIREVSVVVSPPVSVVVPKLRTIAVKARVSRIGERHEKNCAQQNTTYDGPKNHPDLSNGCFTGTINLWIV
jgi:hypothetical protein